MEKFLSAFEAGKPFVVLNGSRCELATFSQTSIFRTLDKVKKTVLDQIGWSHYRFEALEHYPESEDITEELLEDIDFGGPGFGLPDFSESKNSGDFIDLSRLDELREIDHPDFDLSRLIRICEEINDNYGRENYISVVALLRTLINHVPPIFGFETFKQTAAEYKGGTSLKANLNHLQNSLKHIADRHLHQPIRKSETLPGKAQVKFQTDLDVLLEEIVRVLKRQ